MAPSASPFFYPEVASHIDGMRTGASGQAMLAVENPATGEMLGQLPKASDSDIARALTAAGRAYLPWRHKSPFDRSAILREAAARLREQADSHAHVMSLEQGKPIAEARGEIAAAAAIFEWFAEEGRRIHGRTVPGRTRDVSYEVIQEPVGPVAAFTPWNFPATSPARKIAASLAAGCSCIIKPSEETPATALAIVDALERSGLPPGTVNVLFGDPAHISASLIASPVIRKISLTGSTPVGKLLGTIAAQHVKRTTMELGGHAPVLVFDDADIERTADLASAAKFRNAGQVCISPTRFLVHEKLHSKFVEAMKLRITRFALGPGYAPKTTMGPLANQRRLEAVHTLIQDANTHGGQVIAPEMTIPNQGYFMRPTLLVDVPVSARIMNEEPFGPVAIINKFSDTSKAIEEANRLPFGLAAYAFTHDQPRITRLGHEIEAGMLGINSFNITIPETPFGGIKESGHGSEGGREGLDAYLVTRLISKTIVAA